MDNTERVFDVIDEFADVYQKGILLPNFKNYEEKINSDDWRKAIKLDKNYCEMAKTDETSSRSMPKLPPSSPSFARKKPKTGYILVCLSIVIIGR